MAERILIVEDEILIRKNFAAFLRNESYEVSEARDGVQALELLNDQAIDLIISDFVMPHMNGLELLDRVALKWPRMPIIFLTGYLADRPVQTLLPYIEFLQKPVTLDDLLSAVKRLLRRS